MDGTQHYYIIGILVTIIATCTLVYGMGNTAYYHDETVHHYQETPDTRTTEDMDSAADHTSRTYHETDNSMKTGDSSSVTRSEQHVQQKDGDTYVEQSTSGDGTVKRNVETSEDGIRASQHLRHTDKNTYDPGYTKQKKTNRSDRDDEERQPETDPGDAESDDQDDEDDADTDTSDVTDDDTTLDEVLENVTDELDNGDMNETVHDTEDDNGVADSPRNLTNGTGTIDDGTGVDDGVIDITPRSGARILGDQYQTPPAETEQEPDVQPRLSLWDRITLFLRGLIDGVLNWITRAGRL